MILNIILNYLAPSFSVTYLLVDQSMNGLDLDSIDRVKIARSVSEKKVLVRFEYSI